MKYIFLQLANLPPSYNAGAAVATAAPTKNTKELRWAWQEQVNWFGCDGGGFVLGCIGGWLCWLFLWIVSGSELKKLSWHFFYRENVLSSTGYYFEAQFKNNALGDLRWQFLLRDLWVWGTRQLLRWSLSHLLFHICTGCIWNTCNYWVKLGLLTDIFGFRVISHLCSSCLVH